MTTQPLTDVSPSAFLCYAHIDDQQDDGALSDLRKRLSGEVRVQTGAEFPIFQDIDMEWGENWKQRIDGSLNAVTFLICILTPSFFKRAECRREVKQFLEREAKLGRNDLILTVYYITCPTLEDDSLLAQDEIATELAKRQRENWRDLRHKPITSPEVRERIDKLGGKIIKALSRVTVDIPGESGTSSESLGDAQVEAEPEAQRTTRIVKPGDSSAHSTIAEAIEAANHGDRILVHPGLYEDPLVIDKAIEIAGQGSRDEIVVQVTGANALRASTNLGRVANLTLRQAGGGEWHCVYIPQGRLELEECDISSESLACVAISDGADPRITRNSIHHGNQSGVFVLTGGLGTIEDNDIFNNAFSGVEIKEGANPSVRGNRIHDGKTGGLMIGADGLGTIEGNEIFGNALAGVEIKKRGNPTVRGNRIHDGKQSGVYIHTNGLGTIEGNDILGNAVAGVGIESGGRPIVRGNRINGNAYHGIVIREDSGGTYTDNDLRDNANGPWLITDDSISNVERSGNIEDEDTMTNLPDA